MLASIVKANRRIWARKSSADSSRFSAAKVCLTDHKGSGRDYLANWIADPNNPLTARVMVNRIWQYHFGKGLVPTPNDFGSRGEPPSHPELLDYLATQFIKSGWSSKAMHRMIMLSHVYQLSASR